MGTMLDFLFSSALSFPRNWTVESQLGAAMDETNHLSVQIKVLLGEQNTALWKEYQEKVQSLQNQECRTEFERGFLMAAKLALETASALETQHNQSD